MSMITDRTPSGDTHPCAIVHPNGAVLYLPTYHPLFVQRFTRAIPAKARVYHQLPTPRYTVCAPYHRRALALAAAWWRDFVAYHTDAPYTYPGDDRHLAAQLRAIRVAS